MFYQFSQVFSLISARGVEHQPGADASSVKQVSRCLNQESLLLLLQPRPTRSPPTTVQQYWDRYLTIQGEIGFSDRHGANR